MQWIKCRRFSLCWGWVFILLLANVCQVRGDAVLDIADPDNPPSGTQETVGWRTSGNFPVNLTVRLRILAGENRQIVSTTVKCIELDTSVHTELNYTLAASYYKTWTPSNNKDYRAVFPAVSWHRGNYRIEGSYTWRQMLGGQTGTVSAAPLTIILKPWVPENVMSHWDDSLHNFIRYRPELQNQMGVDYTIYGYAYLNPASNWVPIEVKFYDLTGNVIYTYPPHAEEHPSQHAHPAGESVFGRDIFTPGSQWGKGLYTFQVKALLPGVWPVSDKSAYLTINNGSNPFSIISSDENRNVTARISYSLADSQSKPASSSSVDVLNPDLFLMANGSGSGSLTTQYIDVNFTIDRPGKWPWIVSSTDNHQDSDKAHSNREALQKGGYWIVKPAVAFGADYPHEDPDIDFRSNLMAEIVYQWLGLVRKPPSGYTYYPYQGCSPYGGLFQDGTSEAFLQAYPKNSVFFWSQHTITNPATGLIHRLQISSGNTVYLSELPSAVESGVDARLAILFGCHTLTDNMTEQGISVADRFLNSGYSCVIGSNETVYGIAVGIYAGYLMTRLCQAGENVADAIYHAKTDMKAYVGDDYYNRTLIASIGAIGNSSITLWW